MARYRSPYSRRRGPWEKWIYIVVILLIVVAVLALVGYNPFAGTKDKPAEVLPAAGPIEEPVVVVKDEPVLPEPEPKLPEVVPEPEPKLPEVAPEPIFEPNSKVVELIDEAAVLVNAKPREIIRARDILNEALLLPMNEKQQAVVKEQLSELADEWLFSRTNFPQDKLCGSYNVKQGKMLSTIAGQFKVPWEILAEINNIRPEALRAGESIKVINGPFHARIYRSTFTMDLYLQDTFVRSFPVGLGKPGRETPMGLWTVKRGGKLVKPTWTDPDTGKTYEAEDPDYPLGSRWIALKGLKGQAVGRTGIAIHGTKDPKEIGTAGSRGCIRLHNGDAILIYNLLVPGFSRVEVVD